jgi:Coenzyme PQQ synthesis protein D (PqqD)
VSALRPEARRKGLVTREWQGDTLVYDLETHRAHCLNPVAGFVWEHCDGRHSVAQIVSRGRSRFGAAVDADLVRLALRQLWKAGLLEQRPERPAASSGLTRREAARRLARLGALSALLPAVTSIIAPTPAAAATCLPLKKNDPCLPSQCGQPCGKCAVGGTACLNFGGGLYECNKGGVCP